MKRKPLMHKTMFVLAATVALLLAVVVPAAAHHRAWHDGGPKPSESPTPEPTPEPEPEPYPPPSTETSKGTFGVRCDFSHRLDDDPIVFPGQPGASHTHVFFGNTTTDAYSTLESLLGQPTTCSIDGDTAAYWTPTLVKNGQTVDPLRAFIYYRNFPINYGTVEPFPPGFKVVGDPDGDPQFAWWHCNGDSSTTRHASPPDCGGDTVRMKLLFPNCWDGVNLDSPDHQSHVVYPDGNNETACPQSHPHKLPQLYFTVAFPPGSGGDDAVLSDGKVLAHGDFINSWDDDVYTDLHERCTAAQVDCGLLR